MANKIVTLENLGYYHNEISQIIDSKQDVISDLSDIRSNASKGATALQSVPAEYVTYDELDKRGYLYKVILTQGEYDSLTEYDPSALYIISDAGENAKDNFVTESQLDDRGYLTQTDKTELTDVHSNLEGRIKSLEETVANLQNIINGLTSQLENTLIV
jgi:hypothetical protein